MIASPAFPTHHGRQIWFLFPEDATKKEKLVVQREVTHHREAGAM